MAGGVVGLAGVSCFLGATAASLGGSISIFSDSSELEDDDESEEESDEEEESDDDEDFFGTTFFSITILSSLGGAESSEESEDEDFEDDEDFEEEDFFAGADELESEDDEDSSDDDSSIGVGCWVDVVAMCCLNLSLIANGKDREFHTPSLAPTRSDTEQNSSSSRTLIQAFLLSLGLSEKRVSNRDCKVCCDLGAAAGVGVGLLFLVFSFLSSFFNSFFGFVGGVGVVGLGSCFCFFFGFVSTWFPVSWMDRFLFGVSSALGCGVDWGVFTGAGWDVVD